MPRVRFTSDHVDTPHPAQSVKYKAGGVFLVSKATADKVVALRRGVVVRSPGERDKDARR